MSKINIRTVKTLLTESYTITNNEIRLNEAADLTENITIPSFTRVYTTPNAGQFQVLTFEEDGVQYGGKIIFNSADEGKSVDVTYYGWGSIIWAEDFNNHETRITQNETTITNHESRITTLEIDLQTSSYSTPTEETAQVIRLPDNTVKGQISGSVKGRTVPNLLGYDGDFEVDSNADGVADGWSHGVTVYNAVVLDTDSVFGNKSQKMTLQNGGSSTHSNYLHHKINFNVDDKIYVSLHAKYSTLDYNPKLQIFLRNGLSGDVLSNIPHLNISNTNFTRYSTILQATATGSNQGILIRDYHNATTTSFDRWIDGALVINLTQLFGAGNEPTLEECDQIFNFINGTKSTNHVRLRSVGKNLLRFAVGSITYNGVTLTSDGNNIVLNGTASSNIIFKLTKSLGAITFGVSIWSGEKYIKLITNENYTINVDEVSGTKSGLLMLTLRKTDATPIVDREVTAELPYSFINTENELGQVTLYIVSGSSFTNYKINIQLEQGDTATEYEPYKESVVYLPETLRGLPSGVSDEVDVDEGKLKKNTWEKVLENADFNDLYTRLANVDVVRIYKPTDSSFYNKSTANTLGQLILEGYTEGNITISNWDDTSNIGKFSVKTSSAVIDLFVAKGTYANLASAQADLAGTTLIYQLAEPVTKDLDITPLQSFENGTLYVEQTVRDSGIYSGGLSVSNANLPIDSLEAVYKVEGDTKTPVDLSDCTIAADGLSFTITGAVDGEKYEFIYNYPSELGTIPTTEYSVPLNRAAQIDDNTKMINQLSEELGDLWTTLLPLADKELAMFAIADITTDMSTDAFANELKNKINEILSIW